MEIYHHPRIKIGDKERKTLENFTPTKKGALGHADIKEGVKMSFVSDAFWKVMFLNSERIKYTCKLISCIIDVEYEYLLDHLKLISTDFNRETLNSKAEYGDYAADINGQKICIEVNNSWKTSSYDNVNDRSYEYANKMFRENVKNGEKYHFNSVIMINLHNFSYKEIDDWYELYTLNNGKDTLYTDKITILNIYLPKLYEMCYTKDVDELDELEKVLLTLYSEDIAKSMKFGGDIKVMKEYVNEAEKISNDEEIKEVYDREKEYKIAGHEEGLEQGIALGREEGLSLGHTEEKYVIAKNMLKDNIDIETISKYTNLTPDEISSLKENTEY